MHRLVCGAAHAEAPLQVVLVQLLETLALGQQTSVGDARSQRVVLTPQETLHRLYQPRLLRQSDAFEELPRQHAVGHLDTEVHLPHLMPLCHIVPFHVGRGGIGCVELRERRCDEQYSHGFITFDTTLYCLPPPEIFTDISHFIKYHTIFSKQKRYNGISLIP